MHVSYNEWILLMYFICATEGYLKYLRIAILAQSD